MKTLLLAAAVVMFVAVPASAQTCPLPLLGQTVVCVPGSSSLPLLSPSRPILPPAPVIATPPILLIPSPYVSSYQPSPWIPLLPVPAPVPFVNPYQSLYPWLR